MRTLAAKHLLVAALAAPAADAAARQCPVQDDPATGAIKASAQRFSARAGVGGRLSGEVQVEQRGNRIRAEKIDYDSKSGRLHARGNVRYTNCETKKPLWFISADSFTLDHERGVGAAKNAWLVVGGVPLLYLPKYRVSLEDRRKSGFLSPDLGNNSETGVTLALPYYFNLAPNHDAVFEPRILSKRGVQFASNYRYLHRFHQGALKGDWLDDDDYDGGDRYSYTLDHQTTAGEKLRVKAKLQRVSDDEYIEDLSGSFDLIGENYLNSAILADYVWQGWHLNFTAEDFQRSDEDARTEDGDLFERRPSVALAKNLYSQKLNLDLLLRGEWADFNNKRTQPEDAASAEGERFDGEIVVRRPHRRPGFHFTPSAGLRYTGYDVDDRPEQSRTVPWFSLRTGLVFEKDVRRKRYRHTLEPELFYLNVPRRDQDGLPVFDTGRSEFRFLQLFEENRYNGPDRIGDADQLTLALSSRLIHARSGKETLRFSVGHTSYFRDRKVRLPGEDADTDRYDYSDLAAEFALNLDAGVKFSSSLVWDTENERPARHATRFRFDAGGNKILSLSHHYLRGDQGFSQSELGLHLPVGARWSWFGGWWYDLRAGEDVGMMAGFRYDGCCWSLRLAGQRLLQDVDGVNGDQSIAGGSLDYNTTIGIEFSLRGLTKLGTNTDSRLLEKWIPGYQQ